jgi:hypothetical protein
MYPDQIPPEVVIENSDLANKESIIDKITPAENIKDKGFATEGTESTEKK